MHNFFASCGLCSNQPHPGDYAYEAYRKTSRNPSFQQFQGQGQGQGQNRVRNVPKTSVVAGDYTFRDINNDNPKEVYIRKILKSNYLELIKKHEDNGQNFTDHEFPPDQSSIGNVEDLKVRATWKRIPDIVKNAVFIGQKIEPRDIFQGSSGNGYFLSAISALAQNDYRIKNIFPDFKISKQGIYMARILFKGVLREVIVDDYIPVNQQGDPLFAKPAAGRQIWIMILEKCWAKLNGSFGEIVGGLSSQVLRAFSAAPTMYHQIPTFKQKQEQLWQIMERQIQNGAIFCAATKSDPQLQSLGLLPGYSFTILQIYQYPYRLIKFRNIYSNIEWRGRGARCDRQFWSTISPLDRQKLEFSQQNPNVFFLLWEDFINVFDILDICKVNDNASYSNCQSLFSGKNAEMFQFQTEGGNVSLSLNCQNQNSTNIHQKRVTRSIIIVARQTKAVKGFQYKYIWSSTNNIHQQHCVELNNLEQGKYIIYAKYLWVNKVGERASIGIYTQTPTHLFHVSQSKHKKFLYQTFLDHARNNHKKQSLGPGQWLCNDLLLKQCGYGYLAFHLNEASTRKLGIQINQGDYTEKRFVLKKPYKGRGIIKTSVSPGNELIILFHIKSQSLPQTVTLPNPKIYNLI